LNYKTIRIAATHVSAASRAAGWRRTTQNLGLRDQLDSDAQALTLGRRPTGPAHSRKAPRHADLR
jgi:hypothetical protein